MHRFYLPPDQHRGERLVLTEGEARHAAQVLRLGRGDQVTVLDGAGLELLCEIRETAGEKLEMAVIQKRLVPPLPCRVTLLQALPKARLIESILQKATELGAARFVPLLTERVVVQLDEREAARKAEKWQRVAIEAIKQCGSAWLPKVEAPMTPRQWLARQEPIELSLLASLQPHSRHPREHFEAFRATHRRPPRTACVWVGPEGDFTRAETETIQAAGALPITLGPLVLRTETAAVYCLSILNYELQAPQGVESEGRGA